MLLSFHHDIKNGPDFVCTCCHRMMYRKSVVPFNLAKYSKCSNDLLQNVFSVDHHYISNDGNEWVCKTCDRALKCRVMPLQAKANGLQLCNVPPELSDLNALELRLISQRISWGSPPLSIKPWIRHMLLWAQFRKYERGSFVLACSSSLRRGFCTSVLFILFGLRTRPAFLLSQPHSQTFPHFQF